MGNCQGTGNLSGSIAFLVALDSSFSYRQYSIAPAGVIVGRDAGQCDIVAAGATISRRHFRISLDEETSRFQIVDLNSLNGLFVNGKRVETCWLEDKDLIGLGSPTKNHLRFQKASGKNSWARHLPSKEAWIIGRNAEADVSLPFEPTVSGRHAELQRRSEGLFIRDLGSLNGTWINGYRIRNATRIEFTDTIVIGSTSFHFHVDADGTLAISQLEVGDDFKLECVGLTHEVSTGRGNRKKILDNISLSLRPGEFVGILGPSGAGKTSFLKSLNGYSRPSSGHVLVNGTSFYQAYEMFRDVIGYVPQDDILHTELTVWKSLDFLARLRLPPDTAAEQRANIIDSTLEALGLSQVRDQRIYQLSGGQRKRVSIAAELITRPSILFLDEPTAGLDPCVEEKLMHHFREMARNGTTVLITTHILYNLDMLDRIIVLSRGKLVFFGKPDEALTFFKGISPEVERPSHIFDVLEAEMSTGSRKPEQKSDIRLLVAEECAGIYTESPFFTENIVNEFSDFGRDLFAKFRPNGETQKNGSEPANRKSEHVTQSRSGGKRIQIRDIFSFRSWRILSERHIHVRLSFLNRSIVYALIPVLLALITISQNIKGFTPDDTVREQFDRIEQQVYAGGIAFGNQLKMVLSPEGMNDQRSAAQIIYAFRNEGAAHFPVPISVLLMFVMTAVFLGTMMSCLEISSERSIYQRERMSHQRILDYIVSKLPFCLAVTLFQCFLFVSICCFEPNLREVSFFTIFLSMVCIAWTSVALGLCISALDPSNGQYSLLLSVIAVLPQLILSGGLGPDFYAGMGTVTRSIADILPARWGLELLFSSVYLKHSGLSTEWIPSFVTEHIGFEYGTKVYWRSASVLLLQATMWTFFCVGLLRRRDTVR